MIENRLDEQYKNSSETVKKILDKQNEYAKEDSEQRHDLNLMRKLVAELHAWTRARVDTTRQRFVKEAESKSLMLL